MQLTIRVVLPTNPEMQHMSHLAKLQKREHALCLLPWTMTGRTLTPTLSPRNCYCGWPPPHSLQNLPTNQAYVPSVLLVSKDRALSTSLYNLHGINNMALPKTSLKWQFNFPVLPPSLVWAHLCALVPQMPLQPLEHCLQRART